MAYAVAAMVSGAVQAQVFAKSSTPWPEFPDPPKAKVEWISNDMRVNGIPMKVLQFKSEVSREEITSYYLAHWDQADPSLNLPANVKIKGAVVSQSGKDTIIGRAHGPFYMTVKVKNQGLGGSQGTMTTSLLLDVTPEINGKGVPAPSDANAINVVESADFGKKSKQVLFLSRSSVSSVKAYYERTVVAAGWRLLDLHGDGRAQNGVSGYVITMAKKNEQLNVIIGNDVKHGGLTVINANLISL